MPKERIAADRGTRRPWGGRAYCSPRGAPTIGRARLSQPEGRAGHGTGGLIAARGMRRLWGGRACCSPRDAPTMGRARLLQPKGQAFPLTVCGRAYCSGAAAELAETFFRSCPSAGRTRQVMRSAAARAEQENPARSKAYRAFARRKHGKAGGRFFEKA